MRFKNLLCKNLKIYETVLLTTCALTAVKNLTLVFIT